MTNQSPMQEFFPNLQRSAVLALAPLKRELNRLTDELGEEWRALTDVPLSPRVDWRFTKDRMEIAMELPGIDQNDVKVDVEGDMMTISGEKKSVKESKDETYRICERSYGAFNRTFVLPPHVDATAVRAVMKDGVLTVTAPRNSDEPTRNVEIQSAK